MRMPSAHSVSRGFGSALLTSLLLMAALSSAEAQQAWTPVAEGFPQTAAELSGWTANTSHLEMWDFLHALKGATTDMYLGTYGETWEGREIPYAVFSKPRVSQPWEAWALGRPIVVLAANVHGGERTFREGLLILMRDFATPGTYPNSLLDKVTVVVTPQLNPDGYETGTRGTRGNAWGIDLNRDYVKTEQPAIAHFVGDVLAYWRPHVTVDSHNGCGQPYNLCYQAPSHYDPAQEITLLADQEIFPGIDARMESEGLRSWYYSGGNEEEWRGGGSEARIGRNYSGFINTIGILFEAPGQDAETGARAGYLGNLSVVEYTVQNADKVLNVVNAARMETMAQGAAPTGQLAVQMEYGAEDYPVSYTIIRGGGRNAEPGTPVDTIEVTGARLMKKPIPTLLRDRPWAYLVPRDAVEAIEMLRRHGITVETLTAPVTLQVQAYTVAGVSHERAYNHAAATVVEVGEVVTVEQNFPAGTYVIPTAQFLGRLAAHMLEAESTDNVVYWNTMDAWLPRPQEPSEAPARGGDPEDEPPMMRAPRQQGPSLVPIFKLMAPTALPTQLVEGGR